MSYTFEFHVVMSCVVGGSSKMSDTSESSSSLIWEPTMADGPCAVFEYCFVEAGCKYTGVYDLPKGTGWLSVWKETYAKLENCQDIWINASGISNSSHKYLSYRGV